MGVSFLATTPEIAGPHSYTFASSAFALRALLVPLCIAPFFFPACLAGIHRRTRPLPFRRATVARKCQDVSLPADMSSLSEVLQMMSLKEEGDGSPPHEPLLSSFDLSGVAEAINSG